MELIISIISSILLSISLGVLGIWIYFAIFVSKSLRYAPKLDKIIESKERVDVILPARNEEKFIAKCLDSLLKQDYTHLRIIAIDDSSTDNTANIIKEYARRDDRVVYLHAGEKPEGWTGKNWACYQGYLRSDADLLLFTDADSTFANNLVSLAVSKFVANSLDALTLMPRIQCFDIFTKITLPLLNNILYSRYSPLRVNDPKNKLGYFFGSFFIIKRSVYEKVGTHKGVKDELVEDGALGSKVKNAGYKLMMARAEEYFNAVWARDFHTLWNALGRLVAPLYANAKFTAIGIFLATFFLFLYPFISLIYSIIFQGIIENILLVVNIITCIIMLSMSIVQAINLRLNPLYALGIPIGAVIIVFGFLGGILNARRKGVRWRDRDYVYKVYKADGFQP
ncbi:MAG: glycosyltransferase [Candidatus Nitrosothermus koennekii]|nr:MAG: glycosyltransferase [Candidatus Nitrosothermus koennekii]